jgi:hypothetical protein
MKKETKTQDNDDNEDDDAFGNAFHNVELSAAARAREQEIHEEVDAKP